MGAMGAKRRLRVLGTVAAMGALVLSGGPWIAVASAAAPTAYTCSGGSLVPAANPADPPTVTYAEIPSGTYSSIAVTGVCDIAPGAVINVLGNFAVAAGAIFDAQGAPAMITVGRNFTGTSGSIFALGCLPNPPGHTTGHPCGSDLVGNPIDGVDPDTASSDVTINGNVVATDSNVGLMYGVTVKGNVVLSGGGGPFPIPWAVKDNSIGGNLVVSNMTPNWFGLIRNHISGNAILTNVNITDALFGDGTPTIFIASNTVDHNLICSGLGPAVSRGFGSEHNTVGHQTIGQCVNLPAFIPGG